MSLKSLETSFLTYCRNKRLSEHTVRAYRQDLSDFSSHFKCHADLDDFRSKDCLVSWITRMRERDLAPASIKRRIACVKVFFRWLEKEGCLAENPFHHYTPTIRQPRNLSKDELGSLLSNDVSKLAGSARRLPEATLALGLELMFTTGIRVGELCGILLPDLDLGGGSIIIERPPRRSSKTLQLHLSCESSA